MGDRGLTTLRHEAERLHAAMAADEEENAQSSDRTGRPWAPSTTMADEGGLVIGLMGGPVLTLGAPTHAGAVKESGPVRHMRLADRSRLKGGAVRDPPATTSLSSPRKASAPSLFRQAPGWYGDA